MFAFVGPLRLRLPARDIVPFGDADDFVYPQDEYRSRNDLRDMADGVSSAWVCFLCVEPAPVLMQALLIRLCWTRTSVPGVRT